MKKIHDSPWMNILDQKILNQFLLLTGLNIPNPQKPLINRIGEAFSLIPYENLTKIIKSGSVISSSSAMRYPDELIGDWIKWGTGGTCFSLTASLTAICDALGIESHPVLADRHYGPDTHCGLIAVCDSKILLMDPGYLMCFPIALPSHEPVIISTEFNTIELVPLDNGKKVELHTSVKGNRKLRMTYKIRPVDDFAFAVAWEQSFAWEMMTYPVITRISAGEHQYLQDRKLSIRSGETTRRSELASDLQAEVICNTLGIHKEIVKKALGVIKHG